MAFIVYSDETHKVFYNMETTFGTPIALNQTSFKQIEFDKGQFFDLGVNKTNLMQNRSSRVLSLVDVFNDNFTGPVGYSFTTYCSKDRLADFLYLVTQNRVSQGAIGTGYQKVFRMHASQPDFTANAGAFCTMVWKSPITARDAWFTSGILRDLTITFDKSGAGEANLVKMSGTFLFKKFDINQTFTGSGTARDITLAYRAHSFEMTNNGTGEVLPWDKFSLTINNNAVGIDRDTSGNPVTFFLNPGEGGLKASAEVWYTGTAIPAYLTDFNSGTTVAIDMKKGSDSTDGRLVISVNGTLTNNPIAASNGQLRMPLELMVGNTTAAGTNACNITIADAISQT